MVFVPDPPLSRAVVGLTGTLPRAVPSDAVVDVLSRAVPAEIVQKLLLLAIFVLACSGAAAVLRGWPLLGRLAAGVLFAWNPFVAERLLIGQWALLLGYCGLPWLVVAFREQRLRRLPVRLACALIPAAVGGFSAMAISGLVIIPLAACYAWSRPGTRRRRARALAAISGVAAVLALMTVLSLPWLVPSLLRQVSTDPAGVNVFAARADTPFGSLGSLLSLGGIWNAQVVPGGYAGAATVFPLLLAVTGVAGYALGCRREPFWRGLGAAALIGLAIASIGLTPAGRAILRSLIAAWPGFAVLRDGQQFVAPLALAEAVGLGAAVSWALRPGNAAASADPARRRPRRGAAAVADPARSRPRAGAGAVALGVFGLAAPVLLLPGLAWGGGGRLTAVRYPAGWLAARQAIDTDRAPGSALILPWAAYRRYPWNGGRTMLDPWPRLLGRQAIWNDGVQVGNLQLAPEDPESRRLTPLIRSDAPLTRPLQSAGVRYVIIDTPGADAARLEARLGGAEHLGYRDGLIVYRLPGRRAGS